MRKLLGGILTMVLSTTSVVGQRTIDLPEVVTYATRPMNDIGVQRTTLDSLSLKENVALSMADVLAYNSSLFVKNYGRATLSTVSFRGTSPSHTSVSWNGMEINSPMLGMTDFSMIPAFFIDGASLLHGTSSVNQNGGGLGGSVLLDTKRPDTEGWQMQYVQGIGSFKTFDEFLRVGYGKGKWHSLTRAVYSSSPNDFKYLNRDKKENIYDENHQIIGQYHPTERNRSGAYNDFHILQEVYYDASRNNNFGLKVWYTDSRRELPMLTVDYGDESEFENKQHERTVRAVGNWKHLGHKYRLNVDAGYSFSSLAYDYKRDIGNGEMAVMTRSRSKVHTIFGNMGADWYVNDRWLLTASLKAHQYLVKSTDNTPFTGVSGNQIYGYDKGRGHMSGAVSAKWRITPRLGVSAVLRQEVVGKELSPLIPALFADYMLVPRLNLVLKASGSRNCRYPSLNDLYFLPGGNPHLRPEKGWTYDAGAQITIGKSKVYTFTGSATWFDSYIDDWILWLPTTKGFFSPRNVRNVHSYGVELKADAAVELGKGWRLGIDGSFSWTPSVNCGEKYSEADQAIGRQLPYVPRTSASINGRLSWSNWTLHYKWLHYGRRYTQTSNQESITGYMTPYYMSSASIERLMEWRPLDLSIKLAVNNIFDEEYLSVMSRPMPGINFEIFFSITPKF